MTQPVDTPASQTEIAAAIAELEQYRQRIVDDALQTGKLVRVPTKRTMAALESHPELLQIDRMLQQLREQL